MRSESRFIRLLGKLNYKIYGQTYGQGIKRCDIFFEIIAQQTELNLRTHIYIDLLLSIANSAEGETRWAIRVQLQHETT